MIIYLFIISLTLCLLSILYYTLRYGISPMPSSALAREAILKNIPNNFQGSIYELGAGWGSLAFPIAQKYPNSTVIAYEISIIPYLFCLLRNLFQKQKNLRFKRKDFFQTSLKDANLVVCYLYPDAMWKLKEKFTQELPNGSLVISNTFAIPNQQPTKVIELDDLYKTKVYIYTI